MEGSLLGTVNEGAKPTYDEQFLVQSCRAGLAARAVDTEISFSSLHFVQKDIMESISKKQIREFKSTGTIPQDQQIYSSETV